MPPVAAIDSIMPLTRAGKLSAIGILVTAAVLLTASALNWDLGSPTFVAGAIVTLLVLAIERRSPLPLMRDVSWSVLPLVAGLFILVEGLNRTGVLPTLAHILKLAQVTAPQSTSWGGRHSGGRRN